MSNRVTIKFEDEALSRYLTEMQKRTGDIRPALNVIGRFLQTRIRLGFKGGFSPYGGAWTPLQHRQGQPLRDTGRLQNSMTYNVSGSGEAPHVDVGTNVSYGRVHQFGAIIKPKNGKYLRFMGATGAVFSKGVIIPSRPFMPLTPSNVFVLPQSWSAGVMRAMRAHFDRVNA